MYVKTGNNKQRMGSQAIVIGGSMTGLLSARVLSKHFEHVTLIERDKMNDEPESRKGQPQTRHLHALLASGLKVMSRYFPDLPDELRAGGAILSDMGTGARWYASGGYRLQFKSGLVAALVSRPFLEWQTRRRVEALPNVTVLDECKVDALLTTDDDSHVTGVRIVRRTEEKNREATLTAELVLDTTGRGSAASKWLEALGYAPAEENAVKIDIGYATRIYRRRAGDLVGAELVMITPDPPQHKRGGFIFPMEDDRWIATLAGYAGDRAPTDEAGFLEFTRTLAAPDVYEMIARLEPLSDIYTYRFSSNLRRHYERLTRFPEGYLVMGDAICSFNPLYGQGMTSAAIQVAALDELLTRRTSLDGLWKAFFKRVSRIVDIPWQLSVSEDFRFSETEGKKAPGTDLMNAYVTRVHRATHHDPVVYAALLKVMNLMSPPSSLFQPRILGRVLLGRRQSQPA